MKKAFTYQYLTATEAKWYGSMNACYIVRFTSGFAPVAKYAAIVNGKFANNSETGFIHGNGNLGTGAMLLKDINVLNK
jgi:hypothetical protein